VRRSARKTRKRFPSSANDEQIGPPGASPPILGPAWHPIVARHERDILERAVQAVADQAKKASAMVDEAHNAGLD
jgi:hypothetical protein